MASKTVPAKINVKLIIIIVAAVVVLGVGAFVARHVRREILAGRALAAAQEALKQVKPDWIEVRKQLLEYLSRKPEDVENLKIYAKANLLTRPLDVSNVFAAIDAYRRVLRLTPEDESVYRPLAVLYRYIGNAGELAYIAKQRLEKAPGDPPATVWLARALAMQDEPHNRLSPAALKVFLRIAQYPHETIEERRAALEMELVQEEAARKEFELTWGQLLPLVEYLEKQPEKRPEHAQACALLSGIAMKAEGDTAQDKATKQAGAMMWLNRAVEYAPQSAEACATRAQFRRLAASDDEKARQDALAAAREDLEKADALQPPDPRIRLALAEEWLRHGEPEKVEGELKALDAVDDTTLLDYEMVDPADLVLAKFGLRAELLARKATPGEGAALAEEALAALTQKRHRMVALPIAVELYVAGGKAEQARVAFDEYLEAAKTLPVPEPREKVALLEALVARAEEKPLRVIELLAPVTAGGSTNARLWMMLAEAYSKTGQSQLATRALAESQRLRPGAPAVAAQMAREYARSGYWQEAFDAARQAEKAGVLDDGLTLLRIEAGARLAARRGDAEGRQQLDALAQELKTLRAKDDKDIEIRLRQAMLEDLSGRPVEGAKVLEQAIADCPPDQTLTAELTLARMLASQQRLDDAIKTAQAACQRHKDKAAPYVALSQFQAAGKQIKEAVATLQAGLKTVQADPQKRELTLALAVTELTQDETRAAGVTRLKDLAKQDRTEVRARQVLLMLPEVRRDEALAQGLIDEVRDAQGEGSLLWRLAQAQLWLGQPQWREKKDAIAEALNRCINPDPKWSAPALLLASMYQRLNDVNRAEAVYRRALAANPSAFEVADRLMVLLEAAGRFADAREVLNQVGPGVAAMSDHRWFLAAREGNVTQAIDELQRRIDEDDRAAPRDAASRIHMARLVYAQSKDVGLALRHLDDAEKIAPESIVPTAVRVAILKNAGRPETEVRQVIDKRVAAAEALDPQAVDAKVKARSVMEAYRYRADYLAGSGDAAGAEKDYLKLAELATDGAPYAILGQFYADAGRWDDAVKTLENGSKAYPGDNVLKDRLMRALLSRNKEGDRDRAAQLLAALKDEPGAMGVQALLKLQEGTEASIKEAQDLLERVVKMAPNAVDAHMALFGLAMDRGDYAQARDLVVRGIEANPGRKELVLARAEAERRLNNTPLARELVRSVLQADPDDANALHSLITLALATDPPDANTADEARTLASQALKRKPDDEAIQLANARILNGLGQSQAAIAGLEAYRQTEPGRTSVPARLMLAELYRTSPAALGGDLAKAGERIDEAEELAPDSVAVTQQRLLLLAAEGKFDDLAGWASAYRAKEGRSPDVLFTAASILHGAGEAKFTRLAGELYEEVIKAAPRSVPAHLGLALLSYQTGSADRAESLYRQVLKWQPSNPQALNDLAWVLQEARKTYPEALEVANKGISVAPESDNLRDTRGVILFKMGRFAEARKDFEKLVELRAKNPTGHLKALLELGRTCHKLGDSEAAKRYLDEAIRIDADGKVLTAEERSEIGALLGAASKAN